MLCFGIIALLLCKCLYNTCKCPSSLLRCTSPGHTLPSLSPLPPDWLPVCRWLIKGTWCCKTGSCPGSSLSKLVDNRSPKERGVWWAEINQRFVIWGHRQEERRLDVRGTIGFEVKRPRQVLNVSFGDKWPWTCQSFLLTYHTEEPTLIYKNFLVNYNGFCLWVSWCLAD